MTLPIYPMIGDWLFVLILLAVAVLVPVMWVLTTIETQRRPGGKIDKLIKALFDAKPRAPR